LVKKLNVPNLPQENYLWNLCLSYKEKGGN